MESLVFNRPNLAAAHPWFGAVFVGLVLALVPQGKAQMLMNLAPQAIPNSTVAPGYGNTLSVFKQGLTTPKTGPFQSNPLGGPVADDAPKSTPIPQAAAPVDAGCALKVAQMNDIQRHKVVRVHSGPCLMVFNAND